MLLQSPSPFPLPGGSVIPDHSLLQAMTPAFPSSFFPAQLCVGYKSESWFRGVAQVEENANGEAWERTASEAFLRGERVSNTTAPPT